MTTPPGENWIIRDITKCNLAQPFPDCDVMKSDYPYRLQVWKVVRDIGKPDIMLQELMFKTKDEAVAFSIFIRSILPPPAALSSLYILLIQHTAKTVFEQKTLSY